MRFLQFVELETRLRAILSANSEGPIEKVDHHRMLDDNKEEINDRRTTEDDQDHPLARRELEPDEV